MVLVITYWNVYSKTGGNAYALSPVFVVKFQYECFTKGLSILIF